MLLHSIELEIIVEFVLQTTSMIRPHSNVLCQLVEKIKSGGEENAYVLLDTTLLMENVEDVDLWKTMTVLLKSAGQLANGTRSGRQTNACVLEVSI